MSRLAPTRSTPGLFPTAKMVSIEEQVITCMDANDAAGMVYQEYGPRVYALALRMLGNQADAEDISQEVLLQVVRRFGTFRGDSSVGTWLYRVTINAVLALRRKRATARERHLGDLDGEIERSPRSGPGPEAATLGGELRGRIEAAIAQLPIAYRDPLVLSDIEHLPNAEICAALGLSLAAVKSRIHRARVMMRDALRPYLPEHDHGGVPVRA
jgi:RNA polymerase sigma-70 factor (ECF subfamily)